MYTHKLHVRTKNRYQNILIENTIYPSRVDDYFELLYVISKVYD